MCGLCDRGMPHQCLKSGAFEMGKGSFSAGTRYQEGTSYLPGQEQMQMQASQSDSDDPDERDESPFDGSRIRTTNHHILTTASVPLRANLNGTCADVSHEDIEYIEAMAATGPSMQA